jgi:hypothetical protein
MNMKFKLATLALASLFAVGANATTTDWGMHDTLEIGVSLTPVGAFDDTYLFNLMTDQATFSTAVANNLTSVLGIENGMVSLYKTVGATNTLQGSFDFSGLTGSISHAFGTLAAGDYMYDVTGTGTGTLGGFYSITSTVSAVPEPQSYALFLGGLAAVGFMIRRRQS